MKLRVDPKMPLELGHNFVSELPRSQSKEENRINYKILVSFE